MSRHHPAAWAIVAVIACAVPPVSGQAKESSIRFADMASAAGVNARVMHGTPAKAWIAEANGSGVAVLDHDGDGWMDLLVLTGGTMEALRNVIAGNPPAAEGGVRLYRNLNGSRFQEVTRESGLVSPYWGTGANAADYDNDGDVDVLITAIGMDLLFRNNGDGTFTEWGEQAGLQQRPAWHTGSSFGDIDSDGDLDLYVAGYLDLDEVPLTGDPPVCSYRGLPVFCGPMNLSPGSDLLYRNNGDGTFTDVTRARGVQPRLAGYGFTPIIEDFTADGDRDIFVANDSSRNFLFVNRGDGTYVEDGLAAGVAYNSDGEQQADMGACVGDYDGDGDLDLLTTTFSEDHFPLFRQAAPGIFEDVSSSAGLKHLTTPRLGWACGFSDLDNDGDRDLWVANGHVYPNAGQIGTTTYHQPVSILENVSGRFRQVSTAMRAGRKLSSRGAASADFDNDGRIDLAVVPIDGSPLLLLNRSDSGHAWIGLQLQLADTNSEGIGSRVVVEHCGQVQVATVTNGSGYASRSDPRVHFGLGRCASVPLVTVTTPGGLQQDHTDLSIDTWNEVR